MTPAGLVRQAVIAIPHGLGDAGWNGFMGGSLNRLTLLHLSRPDAIQVALPEDVLSLCSPGLGLKLFSAHVRTGKTVPREQEEAAVHGPLDLLARHVRDVASALDTPDILQVILKLDALEHARDVASLGAGLPWHTVSFALFARSTMSVDFQRFMETTSALGLALDDMWNEARFGPDPIDVAHPWFDDVRSCSVGVDLTPVDAGLAEKRLILALC